VPVNLHKLHFIGATPRRNWVHFSLVIIPKSVSKKPAIGVTATECGYGFIPRKKCQYEIGLNVWLPFLRWWLRVNRSTTRADFAPAAFAASRLSLLF
jgi:hypothetical protein